MNRKHVLLTLKQAGTRFCVILVTLVAGIQGVQSCVGTADPATVRDQVNEAARDGVISPEELRTIMDTVQRGDGKIDWALTGSTIGAAILALVGGIVNQSLQVRKAVARIERTQEEHAA